ncbi:MAG TPA: LuxR family transcriptional regulator [Bradyrhizobium sp.]|nr:LuxR family transcriptional regulator [Bradyrhizobium sp.]
MTTVAAGYQPDLLPTVDNVDAFLKALAATGTREELADLMAAVTRDFGFRHYALIHHSDLRGRPAGHVDIKDYPAAVSERIVDQGTWRRDPVIRGCLFAEHAFLWSDLPRIIEIDRRDREALQLGIREGLNEGITVPYTVLGETTGSCTFAGIRDPGRAERLLGVAQIAGIFAFQAAKRISGEMPRIHSPPRLHPRPRECIVLAGRGKSNKEIARSLALAPRTVDGYLSEARRLFDAHDRTELVIAAILAGEVGLDEVRRRQPG